MLTVLPFGTLDRLILITRHGERERLVKHHASLGEDTGPDGGPSLTQAGLHRATQVGSALRARYLSPATCGDRCLVGALGRGGYESHELRAESSGLARTLGTAEVLLNSLVPPNVRQGRPIPVYSRPDADDIWLRGYVDGKCPAMHARIDEFRSSTAFVDKEAETEALRAEVARALPRDADVSLAHDGAPVRLRDMWNAFDALETAPTQRAAPQTLADAEALAAWLESRTFGRSGGGALCGGAMAAELARRLSGGGGGTGGTGGASGGATLHLFSAHYPLMLCVLTALGVAADSGAAADAWLGERLLGYGSVLALEVRSPAAEGASAPRLTLSYHDGSGNASQWRQKWRELALPLCPDGRSCEVPADLPALAAAALPNTSAWCAACAAGGSQLAACAAAAAVATDAACPAVYNDGSGRTSVALASLLLLAAITIAAWGVCHARCFSPRRHAVASTTIRRDGRASAPPAPPRSSGGSGSGTLAKAPPREFTGVGALSEAAERERAPQAQQSSCHPV